MRGHNSTDLGKCWGTEIGIAAFVAFPIRTVPSVITEWNKLDITICYFDSF